MNFTIPHYRALCLIKDVMEQFFTMIKSAVTQDSFALTVSVPTLTSVALMNLESL